MERLVARLEGWAPRGIWMVPVAAGFFNCWRGQPYPFAHAANAAGVMAIIMTMAAFRLVPREAISTAILCLFGVMAAVVVADPGDASNTARVFIGGLFLVAALGCRRETIWDKALAFGLWSEVVMWAFGNAGRGNFGPDVAQSAIGQAWGEWAWPAQLLGIALVYAYAARRVRTGR